MPAGEVPDSIGRLTEEEITATVEELSDMVTGLRNAEHQHKMAVRLRLRLTCHPGTQTVRADVDLASYRWDSVRVA